VNIEVGGNSLVAQKSNGSWWACGENHYAHLGLPHWFGLSKHLGRPKRIPIKLDVWAWDIGQNTTRILTRRGNIYYLGKRPSSKSSPAAFKEAINKASQWIPGAPPLFAHPGEDWSEKPVKIGELPPEVISALKTEH
jgi:alpha-tubulin suppressor-like RCC1 family protein